MICTFTEWGVNSKIAVVLLGPILKHYCAIQRSRNPPKLDFAQPLLSRSNGGHPQRECTNLPAWNLREIFRFSHCFGVTFWWYFRFGHPNPGKRSTWKISPNFMTPLGGKKGEDLHFALLQGSCSEHLGVFAPTWLVLPRRKATNLGVFDPCHFALLKRGCANSVVGLELAEISSMHPSRDVIIFSQISAKNCEDFFVCMTSGSLQNKHFWHHVMW